MENKRISIANDKVPQQQKRKATAVQQSVRVAVHLKLLAITNSGRRYDVVCWIHVQYESLLPVCRDTSKSPQTEYRPSG
jgi:hypothetical protein